MLFVAKKPRGGGHKRAYGWSIDKKEKKTSSQEGEEKKEQSSGQFCKVSEPKGREEGPSSKVQSNAQK